MRPYFEHDLEAVLQLLLTYRRAGYVHRYPTLWRLKLLISSRLWDKNRDAAVWENEHGDIIGFAMLSKRRMDSTAYVLERIIHPKENRAEISGTLLQWSDQRLKEIAHEQKTTLTLGAIPFEQDTPHDIALLETSGFALVPENYNVYMGRGLDTPIDTPDLPSGFEIVPLIVSDLEEYRALYGFTAVPLEHQKEQIHHPQYQHFVVKNPAGKLVAYLECSFNRQEWLGSSEKMGWIDYLETHPDYHGKGLGLALLLTGLQHLRAHSATDVLLVTTHDNTAAQNLYRKGGMVNTTAERVYRKTILPE